jgi:hypothetical protein
MEHGKSGGVSRGQIMQGFRDNRKKLRLHLKGKKYFKGLLSR